MKGLGKRACGGPSPYLFLTVRREITEPRRESGTRIWEAPVYTRAVR